MSSIFGGKFKYQEKLDMIKILKEGWFNEKPEAHEKWAKKKLKKYKGNANKVIEDINRVSSKFIITSYFKYKIS